jgi:hypothetical protein
VDVAGAERLRRLEHRAEHPVRSRKRAERRDQLLAHPRGEELAEAAVVIGDAECRVARAGKRASVVHEALEHLLDGELGADRQHRVAHRLELGIQLCHDDDDTPPATLNVRSAKTTSARVPISRILHSTLTGRG